MCVFCTGISFEAALISYWEETFSAEIKCRNRIIQYHKQIACVFLYENIIGSSYGLLLGGDLEVGKAKAMVLERVTNNAIRFIIQV